MAFRCPPQASALPRPEALRTGAARYESAPLNVNAKDEAAIYTPTGFSKPGQLAVASGDNLAHLRIVVRDATTGRPTFCRVNIVGADGNFYQPEANSLSTYGLSRGWMERIDGLPRGNRPGVPPVRYYGRFFYCSGEVAVDVPAGPVRIEVWKGFEYRPVSASLEVKPGETRNEELSIERPVKLAANGYYSGDPHLHFPRQNPADDELILNLMEADDIRFGSILAYNDPPGPYAGVMQRLATPQMRGMGKSSVQTRGDYHIASGQEYRSTTYGHINFYMQDGLVLPNQDTNADDWPLYGMLGAEIQKAGGYAIYAHGGYAQSIYADVVQGNVNAVELLQFAVYRGMGLEDWYHVLNCGFRFPMVGASDYPWCRVLGDAKTYVHINGAADYSKWLAGAAAGRSFATSGPMLLLELKDPASGASSSPGAQLELSDNGSHQFVARVRVRSEVAPVSHVQLIVNGQVVEEIVVPPEKREGKWFTLQRQLNIDESCWIAARAFSKATSGAANAEAHTNPVYLYLKGKAPYKQASLDHVVECIDRQIEFHKLRAFARKADVLAYFEKSRDILLAIRADHGALLTSIPANVAEDSRPHVETSPRETHSDDQLKRLLQPTPSTTPAAAQKAIETVAGFETQLVANEPLVCDPIAAEFDEIGQLYVCEMRDYPYKPKGGDKPLGCVRLLRDVDGDGDFDESHVFADGLLWASGVVPWKGGVFVASAPDIWYLKDTDGDFQADVRMKVLTGFGTQNQQAMLNNLKFGPDHMIYGATAGNGGVVRPGDKPRAEGVSVSGHDFRFDPQSMRFETITGTIQFGNSFDDWGNRFVCSEARPLLHIVLPQNYLARNPYLSVTSAINNLVAGPVPIFRISPTERWRQIRSSRRIAQNPDAAASSGTSHHVIDAAAGVTVYRGGAYPKEYYGNVFVGDAQNNLVHRRTLSPEGATFRSERADANSEFIRSSDNWFRPVNFVNAPDGTLYVLDMSREIIESIHIPTDVAQHLDLTRGRDQGRIYRVAPKGFSNTPPPNLADATTKELVTALENPNGWWRDTAHRLIYERQDASAAPALRQLLTGSTFPQARMLALWSLHGLNSLADEDLERALVDPSPEVRENAIRLTEPRLTSSPSLLEQIFALGNDPDARVIFQLAFTLGESSDPRVVSMLGKILRRHFCDTWIRTAVLSSSADRSEELLSLLLQDSEYCDAANGEETLVQLAAIVGARNRTAEVGEVINSLAGLDGSRINCGLFTAVVLGLGNGLTQAGSSLPSSAALPPDAANFMQSVVDRAKSTALADDSDPAERRQAIQLIGCLDFREGEASLAALLSASEPPSTQIAAMDALALHADAMIAKVVLSNWSGYSPAARERASRLLLSRSVWTNAYLSAVQGNEATIAEIDAAGRAQLLHHRDERIRALAKDLFLESPRATVIAAYQSAMEKPGDAGRGDIVFRRECSSCHKLGDVGHAVGPDLASSASHDAEALLANILDPNRYVAPLYMSYVVVDHSGRALSGIISDETATSVTLTRGDGVADTILRSNIAEFACTGQTLMPEGLESRITPSEMADLFAYLGEKQSTPADVGSIDPGTSPGGTEPSR